MRLTPLRLRALRWVRRGVFDGAQPKAFRKALAWLATHGLIVEVADSEFGDARLYEYTPAGRATAKEPRT